MTCQEFIDFLIDYEDGILPPPQRARFDEHLAECPDCVNYLASYRTTIAASRATLVATADPLPADVPVELVQAILAARRAGNSG